MCYREYKGLLAPIGNNDAEAKVGKELIGENCAWCSQCMVDSFQQAIRICSCSSA